MSLFLVAAAITLAVAWPGPFESDRSSREPGGSPLESVNAADLAAHGLELEAATEEQVDHVAVRSDEIRAIAEARGVPLREDTQLVVLAEPHPQIPETARPVWAVIPDRPAFFTDGPAPKDGDTWVLMLFDSSSGKFLAEFSGPYED
jgi:hypothetical protein